MSRKMISSALQTSEYEWMTIGYDTHDFQLTQYRSDTDGILVMDRYGGLGAVSTLVTST
jgi:hypothetical protein